MFSFMSTKPTILPENFDSILSPFKKPYFLFIERKAEIGAYYTSDTVCQNLNTYFEYVS